MRWPVLQALIPVTHLDLLRLKIYGGIDITLSMLSLKDRERYDLGGLYPPIKLWGREYYIALASREEDRSCIFLLSDGRCSVHEFKPLVCRLYPFVYYVKKSSDIDIAVIKKAVGEYPGLIVDSEPIPADVVEHLKRLARVRREELSLWNSAILEWNSKQGYSEDAGLGSFLDFALKKAEAHRKELDSWGMWIK